MKVDRRIVVLHTTEATVPLMRRLTDELLPGVSVYHLLDDSLLREMNEDGITPELLRRFDSFIKHAELLSPQAILCACSSIGEIAQQAQQQVSCPIFRIDTPMAKKLAQCSGALAVAATVPTTLGPTMRLIQAYGGKHIHPLLLGEGRKMLLSGQLDAYRAYLASSLAEAATCYNCIALAQASMADAITDFSPEIKEKFLTSPRLGVEALAAYLSKSEKI